METAVYPSTSILPTIASSAIVKIVDQIMDNIPGIANLFILIGENLSSRQLVGQKILTSFSVETRTENTSLLDSITDNRYDAGRKTTTIKRPMWKVTL